MSKFSLSLADYAALAGLALASVGTVYLNTDAQLSATFSELSKEYALESQKATNERSSLSSKIDDLSNTVVSIVNEGMKKRTDEVLLAMTSLSAKTDQITVQVANMKTGSSVFDKFNSLGEQDGAKTNVYAIGDTAIGTVRLSSFDGSEAVMLQEIVNEALNQGVSLEIKFRLDEFSGVGETDFQRVVLERQIEELSRQLNAIDSR